MALCTHCGSKYTEFRRIDDNFEERSEIYFCQSCKKEFAVSTVNKSDAGTWLMTLCAGEYGYREGYKKTAEIYRRADGVLVIHEKNEDVYKTKTICPKISPRYNSYTGKYDIWYDSFRSMNDPEGIYIVVEYIKLSPELAEKAKNNEAMKAIKYDSDDDDFLNPNDLDDLFIPGTHDNTVLLNDVCSWICSQLGVAQTTTASGGCYVATAVYGSYDCPEVWTLRRYRDHTLAETWYGRAFIKTYYAISPTLVKWFGHTEWFKKMWQGKLDRLVEKLQSDGYESTPYEDKEW